MRTVGVTRPVLVSLAAALLATAVTGAVVVVAQRHAAVGTAVASAREITTVLGRDVVGPALTDAALTPGPDQAGLDRLVRAHVLSRDVVRVKVWEADGTVAYSDDPAVRGHRFPLREDEQKALTSGTAVAELSDLQAPENAGERSYGQLLEVYLGMRTTSGRPVLFETYQRYDRVQSDSRRMLDRFLPGLLGGLVLLFLLQVPLVVSLATRVRDGQRRQADLLAAALDASDRERRRIAADLHDGVVQGLAGASYTLSAAAGHAEGAGLAGDGRALRALGSSLRQWVRELRTLILDITPPRLHDAGLAAALDDLVSTLPPRGVEVSVSVELDTAPDDEAEAVVFRTAQEAVRNVLKHARARHAQVRLRSDADGVLLEVQDDGVGVSEDDRRRRRAEGHVGLDLLEDLARAHGGRLTVTSPGTGTLVRLELP